MDEKDFKRLLDESAAETQRRIDESTAELQRRIEASTAELQRHIDASATETDRRFTETDRRFAEIDRRFAETQDLFRKTAEDLRLHFDVVTESMEHKIGLIAEKVLLVDEKLGREAADIRAEMRQGFADTQAMIKFSHAELDRRIHGVEERANALEERVNKLLERMDRLEAMTATQ